MSAFALFITRNDIIKTTPLGGAVDADALLPFVRTAQEKYILNLIGSVLYNRLQDDITDGTGFSGRYSELMTEYIKPTLIWYACVEYIPFASVQFKTAGAVKHQSEQSTAPTKNELDYLSQKSMDNAEYYATRLQDFLIAYSNELPEFLESVGNSTQVYPDQSNQYFSGINL
jgi:hypothetical protein